MIFRRGHFRLHSGSETDWLVDLGLLTAEDWSCLAMLAARLVGDFGHVEGVPEGGLRFAEYLEDYGRVAGAPLLIVDDVLTTGASMEAQRRGRAAKGVVVFARGPWPRWVKPLFSYRGNE